MPALRDFANPGLALAESLDRTLDIICPIDKFEKWLYKSVKKLIVYMMEQIH